MTETAEIYPESLVSAFHYRSQSALNGSMYWGSLNWYEGGGFVSNLGNTPDETEAVLVDLEHAQWIDQLTRAVFVEFNILNGNTNLFNLVKIAFEMPPTGGVFLWSTVESVQLYRYVGGAGLIAIIVEIGLTLFVIGIIIKEIISLCKKGPTVYFEGFWTAVLVVSLACFLTALGFYVYRSILTVETVENLRNNEGTFSLL